MFIGASRSLLSPGPLKVLYLIMRHVDYFKEMLEGQKPGNALDTAEYKMSCGTSTKGPVATKPMVYLLSS
jgi:hypothetical protein